MERSRAGSIVIRARVIALHAHLPDRRKRNTGDRAARARGERSWFRVASCRCARTDRNSRTNAAVARFAQPQLANASIVEWNDVVRNHLSCCRSTQRVSARAAVFHWTRQACFIPCAHRWQRSCSISIDDKMDCAQRY